MLKLDDKQKKISEQIVGSIDDDGYLDVVCFQYFHYGDLLNFMGMRAKRIATPIRVSAEVTWGAYMGSKGDGIFHSR